MAYKRVSTPPEVLYHYTKKENLSKILEDGKIRKFKDRECWFCNSLEDTLRLMELTVMNEGGQYVDVNGFRQRYPKFNSEEYVIIEVTPRHQNGEWVKWIQEISPSASSELKELAEEFSNLKIGYRGDLKFKTNPQVYEINEALQMSRNNAPSMQGFSY